jgi:hypothetical protein
MTRQITKIQQAALILLNADFDHVEVARLFGMTAAQVRDLCLHKDENEDGQQSAERDRAKLQSTSIPTQPGPTVVHFCEKDRV